MESILFIGHRIPFPPDRGDKIRSHHILKRLARLAPVHVATFADDDADMAEEVELATLARSYRLVRRSKPVIAAAAQALLTRRSVSKAAFWHRELAHYVADTIARHAIGTIYVFSGQMGQYVPKDFTGRVIVDFVDVDSAKFEAYVAKSSGVLRYVNAREGRILRDEEALLAARADASLLITTEEAQLFESRLAPAERTAARVSVLGNGIDSTFFDRDSVSAEPRMAEIPGPRLIFTGQMDYAPNVEAVVRAATRILPAIREALPDATLHVVGRRPAPEVQALSQLPGCHVWGRVDDVRPWLHSADLALVPLEIARGVQNKVFEAMAMALPVVLTSAAATGIGGADRVHFVVADSDQDLADAVIRLVRNRPAARTMGLEARRFVVERQSWRSALEPLGALLGAPAGQGRGPPGAGLRDAA